MADLKATPLPPAPALKGKRQNAGGNRTITKCASIWDILVLGWPETSPKWVQNASKLCQDDLKWTQDGSSWAQDGPKMAQNGPKIANIEESVGAQGGHRAENTHFTDKYRGFCVDPGESQG